MSARRELTGLPGRYRLLQKLGEGGMGAVYLAEDTQLGRQVALKVPHFDAKTKPAIVERFLREARIAASIDHPNLCAVHDVGEVNGVHYFTMPFIQGKTLSSLIDKDKPWSPALAAGLVRKVGMAVAKLHEKGVVHRDLKPSNIMVRDGGEPVLMDFGLARSFTADNLRLTMAGTPLGSPAYMAPEQVAGARDIGPPTDVYGLGVIFYELITGQLPFSGPLLALYGQILSTPAPPPSQRCRSVDPRFDVVCARAMAKKPEERYADTHALTAALGDALREVNQTDRMTQRATPCETHQPEEAQLICTYCRSTMKVTAEFVGRKVMCPGCQTNLGRVSQTLFRPPRSPSDQTTVFGLPLEETVVADLRGSMRSLLWLAAILVVALLAVVGIAFIGGSGKDRPDHVVSSLSPIQTPLSSPKPALALAPLLPLTLKRGESRTIAVRITRTNCPGPIVLELVRASEGITLRNGLVRNGELVGSAEITATVAALEGRHTLRLRAHGTINAEADLIVTVEAVTYTVDLGGVRMEFVHVGKGKFWMGSPEGEKDRLKEREEQKEVTVGEDFYLSRCEVTQEQWEALMGTNPSYFSSAGEGKDIVKNLSGDEVKQFPVESVSWDDAQGFLKKLNARDKDRSSGWLYRLPREVEWEYSCRGGPQSFREGKETAPFYVTNPTFMLSSDQANFDGNSPYGIADKGECLHRPCKVGKYKANALGIYDMHGNVWEWCEDLFQGSPDRVLRGGSWYDDGRYCRAAYRFRHAPDFRYRFIGFRVARVPSGK